MMRKTDRTSEYTKHKTTKGPCWVCGKPSDHSFRMKKGYSPGPYTFSPAVEYCSKDGREVTDWLEAVYKDLNHIWYGKANKKWREEMGLKNP